MRNALLMAVMMGCLAGMATAESVFSSELIFPLQGKHVHGSSIVECPNGDLLACWFHGSGERSANDVQVQGARLRKGSDSWSPVFTMADTPDLPDCNPVLFVDEQDRLWLFWIAVVANRWEHSILKYRRAEDYLGDGPPDWSWQDVIVLKPGEEFAKALEQGFKDLGINQACWAEFARAYEDMLVEAAQDKFKRQKGWMTRIHPTVLPSGRIVLPLYSDGFNVSLTALSDDDGETWRASGPIVGMGPIQPTIARRKDGTLVAYMRDSGGEPQRVLMSTSYDDGETWAPCVDIDIPNPSSSLEVTVLQDGRWALIHNDTERGRHSLKVALSDDEGRTWKWGRHLEDAPRDSHGTGSYPSMFQARDGLIHASYSYKPAEGGGAAIKHVAFSVDWLLQGD